MNAITRSVVVLVGGPATGKTTIADHLVAQHGFVTFSVSEVLRIVALANRVNIDDFDELHEFARQFRSEHGHGELARFATRIMDGRNWSRALVEGVRTPDSVSVVRAYAERNGFAFFSIGVVAPKDAVIERMLSRARARDPKSIASVTEYVSEWYEKSQSAVDQADLRVANTGSIDEMLATVERFLEF